MPPQTNPSQVNQDALNFLHKFSSLPPELQDLLSSSKLGETIKDALHLAQVSEDKYYDSIFDLVSQVLMLELPLEKFPKELKKIPLPQTQLQILQQIIQQKIFLPVKSKLLTKKLALTSQAFPPTENKSSLSAAKIQKIAKVFSLKKIKIPTTNLSSLLKQFSHRKESTTKITNQTPQPSQNTSPTVNPPLKTEGKEKSHQNSNKSSEEKKGKLSLPPKLKPSSKKQSVLPETLKVKIEKPVQPPKDTKKINLPKTNPEIQKKIHQKLLQVMKKREFQPEIVKEMKEVESHPSTLSPKKQKQKKIVLPGVESSQVFSGSQITSENSKQPKSKTTKPYIFNVKLKEERKKNEKKEKQPEEPIPYQKFKPSSPFGET